MTSWRRLEAAVLSFENIQREFAQNSDQRGLDWRRGMVELRRALQDRLIAIRGALQAYEDSCGRSPDTEKLASALSALRTAIALHQANWPVVAIDTDDSGYRAEVKMLRGSTSEFRKTARTVLERLHARG